MGKGMEGRGQGMECLTPYKPLPLSEGKGIPSVAATWLTMNQFGKATAFTSCGSGGYWNHHDPA